MKLSLRDSVGPYLAVEGWTMPFAFTTILSLPLIRGQGDDSSDPGPDLVPPYTAGDILRRVAKYTPSEVLWRYAGHRYPQLDGNGWAGEYVKGMPSCFVKFLQKDSPATRFTIHGEGFDIGEPIKIKQGTAHIADTTATWGYYTVDADFAPGYYIVHAEGQNSKRVSTLAAFIFYQNE